jgi:hypothetical protein
MSTPVKIKLTKEVQIFGQLQKVGTEFDMNKDLASRLVGKNKAVYVKSGESAAPAPVAAPKV